MTKSGLNIYPDFFGVIASKIFQNLVVVVYLYNKNYYLPNNIYIIFKAGLTSKKCCYIFVLFQKNNTTTKKQTLCFQQDSSVLNEGQDVSSNKANKRLPADLGFHKKSWF